VRRNGRFAVRLFRSRWITLFATADGVVSFRTRSGGKPSLSMIEVGLGGRPEPPI